MSTQILHISDTHLGNRQYGSDIRKDDFARAFNRAIDIALDCHVAAVIHTGDLFDDRSPGIKELNRCIDTLARLAQQDIPFYAVVGNHDRKMDDQWLDLIRRTGTAQRLSREPTMVGEVALYGIDAVRKPARETADFTLTPPDRDDVATILCMHELVHPPVPELFADYQTADVVERVDLDLDVLALGDYHEPEGTLTNGTKVWYAGSTERCNKNEESPRSVSLITVKGGSIQRERIELETRDFCAVPIEFAEEDTYGHVENVLEQYEVEGKVVPVVMTGTRTSVTSNDVRSAVLDKGAAVCRVKDNRGREQLGQDGAPPDDVDDPDTVIDRNLADAGLGALALDIEQRIRTRTTSTGFDEDIEAFVEDAQREAFAEQKSGEEAAE